MKVSIVIPLFNKASHIARALDSALSQSYTDFEIIVVDDGSTDAGGRIVEEYTDPRIRLVIQTNSGVSGARNRGVHESRTEWIAFLDADDEWLPDFLDTVLRMHRRFPEAAVLGTAYRQARRNGQACSPRFHGILPTSEDGGLIDYFAGTPGNSPLHSSAILINKKALLNAGEFPIGIVYGEDHDTWLRLALRFQIAWSPQIKVIMHEDSENRSDEQPYVGNYPFISSVRHFLETSEDKSVLSPCVYDYLARRHAGLLNANWLAGNMVTVREIARDCRSIRGYRFKSHFWYALSFLPYSFVLTIWRLRRTLAGRKEPLPSFRSIRRKAL